MNDRKKDHIELAMSSQITSGVYPNLSYEPMIACPVEEVDLSCEFYSYQFGAPLWISSMTGGTKLAKIINRNLARLCQQFKLGMGLGSCRSLLESDDHLEDFDVKHLMPDRPLFANLGIAQVEQYLLSGKLDKIHNMMKKIQADALFVHINPLQELAQPEGDVLRQSPIKTVHEFLNSSDIPVFIKEVGQGMGPKSMNLLWTSSIAGFETASLGGTNFTKLESARQHVSKSGKTLELFSYLGHDSHEMLQRANLLNDKIRKLPLIISGGVKDVLQAHELFLKSQGNTLIGMASWVLNHAQGDYEELERFMHHTLYAMKVARSMVFLNEDIDEKH